MRNSTAYFAGVATVFTATALGFGGALILTSATNSRTSTEPTKLERSVASPVQASPPPDTKTATTTETKATAQSQAPATPAQLPQSVSLPSEPAQSASTTLPTPASVQQPSATPEQSATDAQAKAPANAFAGGTDEEVRKYIHKRERRRAHRHYRNDDATTSAQVSNSADPNAGQPTTPAHSSSDSSTQPAAQEQAQPRQSQTHDQTASRAGDSDAGKMKRKHHRHWTRSYARDDDERARTDGQRSLEVQAVPPEDAPQPLFGVRRWSPVLDDGDD